ncbi:MAG: ATP-binding protein [Rhizobiaceae bacterium]
MQGTGLGLAIVKNAVDKQGGRITGTSAPGEGTRFTVWLPSA